MPEPIRLSIMKRLTEEIAARADLDGAVFRGRDYFGEENGDPVPMVTIFEDPDAGDDYPVQTKDGSPSLVSLPLIVVGIDDEDRLNPTDNATLLLYRVKDALRSIKADGRRRRGLSEYLGIPEVDRIEVGRGHVRPAYADGFTHVASFRLPVTVVYAED